MRRDIGGIGYVKKGVNRVEYQQRQQNPHEESAEDHLERNLKRLVRSHTRVPVDSLDWKILK